MSTTQGPYTVKPLVSRTSLHQIVGPGMPLEQVATQENHLNFYWRTSDDVVSLTVRAQRLNAAYAAGQSSKQAELDKAVDLLRELRESLEITGACETFLTMHKPYAEMIAYLSTLNPQPDATQ